MIKKMFIFVFSLLVVSILVASGLLLFKSEDSQVEAFDEASLTINLPSKPDDFVIVRRDVSRGVYPDICQVPFEYYIQPDFYLTWEDGRDIYYEDHDYSRWGVHGYGAYPGDIGFLIKNLKEGDEITTCTFFKSSWGVETFQGVKLQPITNEYFDVSVDPQIILLTPTFPIFDNEWVRVIKVKATVKKNVPVGEYKVGFTVVPPGESMDKEFTWRVLERELYEDIDYVDECKSSIEERKISKNCESWFLERQKQYISGGQWDIGRNTFNMQINVEG